MVEQSSLIIFHFCSVSISRLSWITKKFKQIKRAMRNKVSQKRPVVNINNLKVKWQNYRKIWRVPNIKTKVWKCSLLIKKNKSRNLRSKLTSMLVRLVSSRRKWSNSRKKMRSKKVKSKVWRHSWPKPRKRIVSWWARKQITHKVLRTQSSFWKLSVRKRTSRKCIV